MDVFVVSLMALFFLVEALVELIQVFQEGINIKSLVAFILGGMLAWFFGVDLFSYIGVSPIALIPGWVVMIVNAFFMGVLVSRYAGEINGLLEILKGFKVDAQSRF